MRLLPHAGTAVLFVWTAAVAFFPEPASLTAQPIVASSTEPEIRLGHAYAGVPPGTPDGAVKVSVPLTALRLPPGARFLDLTVRFASRELDFEKVEFPAAEGGALWRARNGPGVTAASGDTLRLELERLPESEAPLLAEEPILELVFSVETGGRYPGVPRETLEVRFAEQLPEGGFEVAEANVLRRRVEEGLPPEAVPARFTDGAVRLYFASGVEVGSAGLTYREQEFIIPLYLTYLKPFQNIQELSVGVDYDELILLRRVRTLAPPSITTEVPYTEAAVEVAGRRRAEFRLRLLPPPSGGIFVRAHVADLRFRFLAEDEGGAVAAARELSVVPELVPEEAEGEGAARDAYSLGGVVRILEPRFVRGNLDSSLRVPPLVTPEGTRYLPGATEPDVSDAVLILEGLFLSGFDAVPCLEAADVDASGEINLSDAVSLLRYLFRGDQPPPPPFPLPGPDPRAGEPGHHWGCLRPLPVFLPLETETGE